MIYLLIRSLIHFLIIVNIFIVLGAQSCNLPGMIALLPSCYVIVADASRGRTQIPPQRRGCTSSDGRTGR